MTPTVHVLIPAAGASSRMRGADKLLQTVGQIPLLRHVAQTALATGSPVTVTLPPNAGPRTAALAGLDLRILGIADAAQGMSRSLAAGIAVLAPLAGPEDALMVLPADMPDFTTGALFDLIMRFRSDPGLILRGATMDGRPGHPVIFPRAFWPALAALTGDEGGRHILQQNKDRVRVMPLPGAMALLDLDTPEDWAAWRSSGLP